MEVGELQEKLGLPFLLCPAAEVHCSSGGCHSTDGQIVAIPAPWRACSEEVDAIEM